MIDVLPILIKLSSIGCNSFCYQANSNIIYSNWWLDHKVWHLFALQERVFVVVKKVRNYNAMALREETLTYQYFLINYVFVVKCTTVAKKIQVVIQ